MTMAEKSLRQIADEMKQLVIAGKMNWVHQRLPRGLEIVLQRTGHRWRLAVARTDTYPSEIEINIVRAAFGVPGPTETTQSTVQRTGKSGSITYHKIECDWIDYHTVPA